ncbi:zinc-binding protein A33-like [Chanos chanos]|uniref:Zinc-binding protein A33-like n=1 Tax=Chanos chanos TaxID=29144 RepID=A0A6J2WA90_CHACN|nr:zinc-binding protein A33-like [Chanos chanos]
MVSGELIDMAKHLGNLKCKVWANMMDVVHFTPVTLDPNTAHPDLIFTEDLSSVRDSDENEEVESGGESGNILKLPTNPERFNASPFVLGSQGFQFGIHSWDVEVGDNTFWMIGIATKPVKRMGQSFFPSKIWSVSYDHGRLGSRSPGQPYAPISLNGKLERIRVRLDLQHRKVTFSDPLTHTHLYTFSDYFTEAVFPFFYTLCSDCPLRILPQAPLGILK